MAHHHDRADTVDFDYRAFLKRLPSALRGGVLAAEWALIPAVELLMHARTALAPLVSAKVAASRRVNAAIGTAAVLALWALLASLGGAMALLGYFASTALMLHVLSMHDAFQHTYTVTLVSEGTYVPGPGARTAKYEEENTFSNVISTSYPLINALTLNFGYHNAHHRKPMTPWYKLPALHASMYGAEKVDASPQVLPFRVLAGTWFRNRLRRVLEEDYGCVAQSGVDRAAAFVGSLGVSFLTV
jgi:fatty acid desaturase